METSDAVAALAALAQESRLAIFRLLVRAGPQGMAAGRISEATGIAPSSLSFHLKELAHARMVRSRQEGRFVIYQADFPTANALVAFLTENCCGGAACELAAPPVNGKKRSGAAKRR
jgi:DNA-binding transcriptional ArsR family regulator